MKILILGASGQIGSLLFNALKAGHDVTGTSRSGIDSFLRFDPFTDDWKLLGTQDVLINCVGQIEATKQTGFSRIHIELTELILKNRSTLANPRILQISALGASPSHSLDFLRTKGIADQLLFAADNATVLRPSIVCTHQTMLVKKLMAISRFARFTFGTIPVPKGFLQTRIQPVMPADLAAVVEAVLKGGRTLIEVVGPEQISFNEILRMLFAAKNKTPRVVEISREITDFFVMGPGKYFSSALINDQQYQLLFADNVGDEKPMRIILDRPLLTTRPFFMEEFNSV